MRGFLLLALGGTLIWFGVSLGTRGDGAKGPIYAGDPNGGEDRSPEPLSPQVEGVGQAPVAEVEPEGEPAALPEVDPAPPQASESQASEPRVEESEPVMEPDPQGIRLRATGPARALNSRGLSVAPSSPGFQVQTLARVLLESWLREDPTSLQAMLDDEQQVMPPELRALTVQFWETLVQAKAAPEHDLANGQAEGPREVLLASVPHVLAGGQVPVVQTTGDPLARAMRMVLLAEAMGRADQAGQHSRTALNASELMDLELAAPWAPHRSALLDWSEVLNGAQDHHRLHPEGVWSSMPYMVESGDNLVGIRKKFMQQHPELRICVGLLRWVNATGKYLHPGQTLRIPTDASSVEIHLDARLLVYRHGTEMVRAWEVGIGMQGHETPLGEFVIGDKEFEPSWPGQGGLLPYGHPDNPLGTRWLGWNRGGEKSSFGIHGTREPEGVGGRVSYGCVRMCNGDVEELFELLPRGSRVRVHP